MKPGHVGTLVCLLLVVGLAFGPGILAGTRTSAPTEVAVLTGLAADGTLLPLPAYPDGTPAAESECRWIVSISQQSFSEVAHSSNTIVLTCTTEGRLVRCYATRDGSVVTAGTANYMVIAVRAVDNPAGVPGDEEPASHRTGSWGGLKSEFGGR